MCRLSKIGLPLNPPQIGGNFLFRRQSLVPGHSPLYYYGVVGLRQQGYPVIEYTQYSSMYYVLCTLHMYVRKRNYDNQLDRLIFRLFPYILQCMQKGPHGKNARSRRSALHYGEHCIRSTFPSLSLFSVCSPLSFLALVQHTSFILLRCQIGALCILLLGVIFNLHLGRIGKRTNSGVVEIH